MLNALRNFAHGFLGRGEATITVPSFDGALKPNRLLEDAEILSLFDAPEDLATDGQSVFLADGRCLRRVHDGQNNVIRDFGRNITALACLPDGRFAVALEGREVHVYSDISADKPEAAFTGDGMFAVNALADGQDGTLLATDGSATRPADSWVWDLMERGNTGRLLRLDPATGSVAVLAQGLQYAFGASMIDGRALVSESWRHRLVAVDAQGRKEVILSHLPAYPSRLSPAAGGGWWLTAFIARTQLVEFVLREPAYRKRMMAEIEPEHWIAPRLSTGASFKEPMQGAHLKTMGVVKPWAPPRSYGLVIRLSDQGQPLFSLHSRADGSNHGVVSAVECNGDLYLLAKGPRRLLRLPVEAIVKGAAA